MPNHTIHLAVYNTMADWEVGYVMAYINSPEFQKVPNRYEVKTVGETLEPITTKGGLRILPDLSLDMLIPDNSRMLILPGADTVAEGGIDAFAKMAAHFLKAYVTVAAICGATAALAKIGLLDAVPHTSNARAFLEMMTNYKGTDYYQDVQAITSGPTSTSGTLITASGIAPVAFAVEIFRELDLYSGPTLAAWIKLYQNQDPNGFYELMAEHAA
ncbi:DJ-1/PfpI family protein [Kiloniella antarctica]|uniref:DJ-1/PfpI family protein n=1 Tax=Kiloniella antarctica TaxID=1550907 RepID=A0ABW5BKA1_9PROT